MALNICNPEAEKLAAELAKQTGETKTEAVTSASGTGLPVRPERSGRRIADELEEIAAHFASLRIFDKRTSSSPLQRQRHFPALVRPPDSVHGFSSPEREQR